MAGMSLDALAGVETARAGARARVWKAGGAPASVTLDFDATLVTAHSDKQEASPTYKRGFGFHPLLCTLDETGEALAAVNRPGNAGANDAALAQLPTDQLPTDGQGRPVLLARAGSAGATHAFINALPARGLGCSVGFDLTVAVREAVLALDEGVWTPARTLDGGDRDGAQVAELTGLRPGRVAGRHPGDRAAGASASSAQLTFTDIDGHRFQTFITDQIDSDVAALELRHRGHARVGDRIRAAKATGLRTLPFHGYLANEAWIQLVLMALDLTAWTATPDLRRTAARRRTETFPLPSPPHRGSAREQRPHHHAAPRSELAVGCRPGRRLQTTPHRARLSSQAHDNPPNRRTLDRRAHTPHQRPTRRHRLLKRSRRPSGATSTGHS